MSHDKGADTRKVCTNGCIGCKKCEKVCEFGAITVDNNCAHIDPEKCTNCGKCAEGCPVKCIHLENRSKQQFLLQNQNGQLESRLFHFLSVQGGKYAHFGD